MTTYLHKAIYIDCQIIYSQQRQYHPVCVILKLIILILKKQTVIDSFTLINAQHPNDFKWEYYSSRIKQHKTDSKELIRLSDSLMGFNGDIVLPSHTCRKWPSELFNVLTYSGYRYCMGTINKLVSKFCELDPLPTWLLK